MKKVLITCDKIIIEGRTLKDISNEELVELMKAKDYPVGVWNIVMEEYNRRLVMGSKAG